MNFHNNTSKRNHLKRQGFFTHSGDRRTKSEMGQYYRTLEQKRKANEYLTTAFNRKADEQLINSIKDEDEIK